MSDFDKTDAAILDCLQRDGRLSNAKLAEQLALSETPCWRRVKRLEEQGVIEGYQVMLNRRKLGLGVMAFVQLSFTQHTTEATAAFERIIQASPNVLACHNTTGDADFLLQVVGTGPGRLQPLCGRGAAQAALCIQHPLQPVSAGNEGLEPLAGDRHLVGVMYAGLPLSIYLLSNE